MRVPPAPERQPVYVSSFLFVDNFPDSAAHAGDSGAPRLMPELLLTGTCRDRACVGKGGGGRVHAIPLVGDFWGCAARARVGDNGAPELGFLVSG